MNDGAPAQDLPEQVRVRRENGTIREVSDRPIAASGARVVDLAGKTLMPGLIDCHTHLVHAGSRANEFEMRLEGATYEEIARAGGGILIVAGIFLGAIIGFLYGQATPGVLIGLTIGIAAALLLWLRDRR